MPASTECPDRPRSGYRALLRTPGVSATLVPYAAARLGVSMVLLATFLLVRGASGSFVVAGLCSAAYGLAVAGAGPLVGRAVDRRGQTRVLAWCGGLYPLALVALVVGSGAGLPPAALAAIALVAGAAAPPVGPCMRALWPQLVPDENLRRSAFAVEAVLLETCFVGAPALVAALVALGGNGLATSVAAVLVGAGTLGFLAGPASRRWRGTAVRRHWRGPLVAPPIRSLLLVVGTVALCYALLEVAVAGAATAAGRPEITGLLLSLWCAGSLAGGLVFGAMRLRRGLADQLPLVQAAVAMGAAPLCLVHGPLALAAVLLVGSVACAPSMSVQLGLISAAAPAGTTTEAFTWAGTANYVGMAAGNALAGLLVARFGAAPSFLASALGLAATVGLALVVRRRMRPAPAGRATVVELPAEPRTAPSASEPDLVGLAAG